MELWHYGTVTLKYYGTMVLWNYGIMELWHCGIMACRTGSHQIASLPHQGANYPIPFVAKEKHREL